MQQPPDPAASRAVLIGTAGYANLPELTAVTRNLVAMRTMLCDAELWGLADASCRIIADPEKPADIVDGVSEAAREAKDTLVVYYAGHGLLDADNIDLHLALRHSREFRGYTALSYHYVRQVVMRSPARRRIVILDCCYSGRATHTLMGGATGNDLAQHAVIEGTYVLTSSSRDSVSLSPAGEVHTAFTGELLSIVHDGIPDGPDLIDLETLYTHLDRRLRARNRPPPQRCNHNTAGLLPLVWNRARRAPRKNAMSAADVAARAWDVGMRLADVLRATGHNREAAEILTLLWDARDTDKPPDDLQLHLHLSQLFNELGQVDEAAEVLREAYVNLDESHPRDVLARVSLAFARLIRERGDYAKACDVLESAVESLGDAPPATTRAPTADAGYPGVGVHPEVEETARLRPPAVPKSTDVPRLRMCGACGAPDSGKPFCASCGTARDNG
ncbi:caspase family protein [Embleya sp. NPDC050493]|uniref:caspase, EACC1-associated type n=1 Tax=Embleya sp. NPDC050493 TaxID=3363989 RepID=UPI0037997D06